VAFLQAHGVALRPVGRAWRDLCPFHEERTPSFYWYPDSASYHCFGCGTAGDLLTFAMQREQLRFVEAVRHLENYAKSSSDGPLCEERQRNRPIVSSGSPLPICLEAILESCHRTLLRSPQALAYLNQRCIDLPTIRGFQVGYCNGVLSPPSQQEAKELQQCGWLSGKGRSLFSDRIVVPIRDAAGDLKQVYGRHVKGGASIPHRYLRVPHTTMFHPTVLQARRIILCEAIIDALSLYAHGQRDVVSIYGANSMKPRFIEQLTNSQVQHVEIAFDNDQAGNRTAENLRNELQPHGITTSRMALPPGCDVNEVLQGLRRR